MRLADEEKKKFSPEFRSCPTQAKKFQKKFKKLKNIISALFLCKPGCDRLRKREKNFSPNFRSYPTRARKFQKK